MRCRVFIRGIPKTIKPTTLRELLEEQTDGCGEVLVLRDEINLRHNQGYALASYDNFSLAVEACAKQVTIEDAIVTMNVVDRPKVPTEAEGGSRIVTNFEFFYKPTIEIDGEAVLKTDLVHTFGLQRALRSYSLPRWCHWTARNLDCELGEQCNFIHRKSCQVTVYPRKRPRELQVHLLPSQVSLIFHTSMAASINPCDDPGKWVYVPMAPPEGTGETTVLVQSDNGLEVSCSVASVIEQFLTLVTKEATWSGCVVGLSTYLPIDAFLIELDDLGERALAHRIDLAIEERVGAMGKRLERFNCAILALIKEINDWIRVCDVNRAVNMLQNSRVFKHACQDTDSKLLLRPWYKLTPGCDLDVWIHRGTVTRITQAYRQLYVPELLRHERNIETTIHTFMQSSFLQPYLLSSECELLVLRVGILIEEECREAKGPRIQCRVLRISHSVGEYASQSASASATIELCTEPNPKMLAEVPQEWIDFIRRRCLAQY